MAERISARAQEARDEAATVPEEATAEAADLLAIAPAGRDRAAPERDAEAVFAPASGRARREAEILLDRVRTELLRAHDEVVPVRAAAVGDATSVRVLDEVDDPAASGLGRRALVSDGGRTPPRIAIVEERRYRMNWERMPTDDDIDALVRGAVSRAVARSVARRRPQRAGSAAPR